MSRRALKNALERTWTGVLGQFLPDDEPGLPIELPPERPPVTACMPRFRRLWLARGVRPEWRTAGDSA